MAFPNQQALVYNDKVVRQTAIMTVAWGVVGMPVGVIFTFRGLSNRGGAAR